MAVETAMRVSYPSRREIVDNLLSPVREESGKALAEIAAYVYKVMYNSVKTAKGDFDHSKPGKPPKAHNNAFKGLMGFSVDRTNLCSWVGASIKSGAAQNDAGQNVASIMEHGGDPVIDTENTPHWLYHKKVPTTANTEQGMAQYFMSMKAAPFGYAKTDGSKGQMTRSIRKAKTFIGKGNEQGKEVYLQYVKMRTMRQALHAARFVIGLFGFPHPAIAKPKPIEPRPFAEPALKRSRKFIERKMSRLTRNAKKR